MKFSKLVVIAGTPRSGTSWLGQIVDSCPNVCYRYQPFFAHAFKNRVTVSSCREDFEAFCNDIYDSNDSFLLQTERKEKGIHKEFRQKNDNPEVLAIKTVRYHDLLERMIELFPDIRVLGIIRNPCGTINSWLTNPAEFPGDADPMAEWRHANCRNSGRPHEYWGFEAWKKLARLFLKLEREYAASFRIVSYERLVDDTLEETRRCFDFLELPVTQQTLDFLQESSHEKTNDKYSVFKNKSVKVKWKSELQEEIRKSIIDDLQGTELERFSG